MAVLLDLKAVDAVKILPGAIMHTLQLAHRHVPEPLHLMHVVWPLSILLAACKHHVSWGPETHVVQEALKVQLGTNPIQQIIYYATQIATWLGHEILLSWGCLQNRKSLGFEQQVSWK